MKKLLLNFIVSLFCLLLAVAQVLATEYTEAANNLQVEWVAGDGTDVYNLTGDNVQAIRSERGFATVNITGANSVVVDNCSEHGCPGAYFNGQFYMPFNAPDGTKLGTQHFPPWYGIQMPESAQNCVINSGAVACTPVLGSELVVNGDFSSATGWTVSGAEITGGKLVFDNDAAYTGVNRATGMAVGKWYLGGVTIDSYTSGSYLYKIGVSTDVFFQGIKSSGKLLRVTKRTGASDLFNFYTSIANSTAIVDDASTKEVIWSTFLSNIVDYKFKTEVKYSADITLADGDIAMIAFKVGDLTAGSEDFCRVELNKGTGKVELKKAVAGDETTPLSAAVTYSAGATLLVRTDATDTDGTKWEVYYNGSQVGADQTLNEASLNSAVAGFMATSASTTFDNWKAGKNI